MTTKAPLSEAVEHRVELVDDPVAATLDGTTLDRVHTAMLLQQAGHTKALRTLLEAEQKRGPLFLRLANGLSMLYHKKSDTQVRSLGAAYNICSPRLSRSVETITSQERGNFQERPCYDNQ